MKLMIVVTVCKNYEKYSKIASDFGPRNCFWKQNVLSLSLSLSLFFWLQSLWRMSVSNFNTSSLNEATFCNVLLFHFRFFLSLSLAKRNFKMTFIITAARAAEAAEESNKFQRVIMTENQALIIHCHRAGRSNKVWIPNTLT